MRKYIKSISIILVIALSVTILASCSKDAEDGNATNNYIDFEMPEVISEGYLWPERQAFPRFSTPVNLQAVKRDDLQPDEKITFSALQGLVNVEQNRIYFFERNTINDCVRSKTLDKSLIENTYTKENKYELLKKFNSNITGIVLYDPNKSYHYRNAAGTIAGLNGYLPVTQEVLNKMTEAGVTFNQQNVIDLTTWNEETALDIYNKIYNEYWQYCTKRLLVVANPGHDLDHCRDMAIAVGAAVVFMDTLDEGPETALYEKFVKDMGNNDSTAIIMGWGIEERSAIVIPSKYGVGLVPADYYLNATVYSGMSPIIEIPPVPKRNTVENKAYITVFLSDGDNIQYVQGAMRYYWDDYKNFRGEGGGNVPVNWTISPALADIDPGLMNYYYTNSTEYECFATGPSGISYLMATNTGLGSTNGVFLNDEYYADRYSKLTETYLQRTGLRVMTMWDDAEPVVRQSFANNARSLYGATVQQFGNSPFVEASVEYDRLRFDKLQVPYRGDLDTFVSKATTRINSWIKSGKKEPLFLSYQVDVWTSQRPETVYKFAQIMKEKYSTDVEFVRADHYFSLYNESKNLPFNLTMLKDVTITASSDNESAINVTDGTIRSMWTTNANNPSLTFNLGHNYSISRYALKHAQLNFISNDNTKDWNVEISADGLNWTLIDKYTNNESACTDIDLKSAVTAKYIRFNFTKPGSSNIYKLCEIEIYGSKI